MDFESTILSIGDEPYLFPQRCVFCGQAATRALDYSTEHDDRYVAVCDAHRQDGLNRIRVQYESSLSRDYEMPLCAPTLFNVRLAFEMEISRRLMAAARLGRDAEPLVQYPDGRGWLPRDEKELKAT